MRAFLFSGQNLLTLWETNIAMKNGPVEDDLSVENGDIWAGYVSLAEGNQLVSFQPFLLIF